MPDSTSLQTLLKRFEPSQAALEHVRLFTGNAHPGLAKAMAKHLGLPLGKANVATFSDSETRVEILENVRDMHIFIVQPTSLPANNNLMEVLLLADACFRAAAKRITWVAPYLGYARQDRRPRAERSPISAKLVANMAKAAHISQVVTLDLHADQIEGFFDIPIDNVYASPVLLADAWRKAPKPLTMVSPDVSGVVRARAWAARMPDATLAIIDKRRARANQSEVMHVIGDVADRHCLIVDDMVDTAGTLCHAAQALKAHGALSVRAYVAHPVLSGPAISRINASELDELVVTNTIKSSADAAACDKIRRLSVAELLAETVRRIAGGESVSELYID